MRQSTAFLALTALATTASSHLLLPRDEQSYIDTVCSPDTTSTEEVAPCIEIQNIEIVCTPNGTTTADYLLHQQCICGGSFFSNWLGCLNCQYIHGARSEAVVDAYENIISSVSTALCTGTPTADFAVLFSSVSQSATLVVAGEPTTTSDLYPGDAAVSLYYTASGSQGPGLVTGAEVSAAATGSVVSSAGTALSGVSSSSGSSSSGGTTSTWKTTGTTGTGTAAAAATSSTETGAAVVNGVGKGLLALAAGAVMVL